MIGAHHIILNVQHYIKGASVLGELRTTALEAQNPHAYPKDGPFVNSPAAAAHAP